MKYDQSDDISIGQGIMVSWFVVNWETVWPNAFNGTGTTEPTKPAGQLSNQQSR